jgi:hypothetical protein
MHKYTTLARLKDDMWEDAREFFKEDNFYHLLRLMYRLKACVDFKLDQVQVSVGSNSLVFQGETIVIAMAKAMVRVEELEQHG